MFENPLHCLYIIQFVDLVYIAVNDNNSQEFAITIVFDKCLQQNNVCQVLSTHTFAFHCRKTGKYIYHIENFISTSHTMYTF